MAVRWPFVRFKRMLRIYVLLHDFSRFATFLFALASHSALDRVERILERSCALARRSSWGTLVVRIAADLEHARRLGDYLSLRRM